MSSSKHRHTFHTRWMRIARNALSSSTSKSLMSFFCTYSRCMLGQTSLSAHDRHDKKWSFHFELVYSSSCLPPNKRNTNIGFSHVPQTFSINPKIFDPSCRALWQLHISTIKILYDTLVHDSRPINALQGHQKVNIPVTTIKLQMTTTYTCDTSALGPWKVTIGELSMRIKMLKKWLESFTVYSYPHPPCPPSHMH